jgi:cell wall assembly regulator SMI1
VLLLDPEPHVNAFKRLSMQDIWNRIELWLTANAPKVLASLQFGASEAEIHQTEAILGVQFPEEVKQYFQIHNGQLDQAETFIPYRLPPEDIPYVEASPCGGWRLLSLKNAVSEWNVDRSVRAWRS